MRHFRDVGGSQAVVCCYDLRVELQCGCRCSVGVTGLVSVMGELAATASLVVATCTGMPPQLTTQKISECSEIFCTSTSGKISLFSRSYHDLGHFDE